MNTELNLGVIVYQTRTFFVFFFKEKVRALKYNCANVLALAFALKYVCAKFSRFTVYALNIKEAASLGKHFVAYILHKIFFSVV